GTLTIKVSLQIAASPTDAITKREASGMWELPTTVHLEIPSDITAAEAEAAVHKKKAPARRVKPAEASSKALDVFWDKRITAATKAVKPSPLYPLTGRPSGKAQSVWAPTTDLKRKWPGSMLLWGVVPVALLSIGGALLYARAFAPAPISEAHTRATMNLKPPVANGHWKWAGLDQEEIAQRKDTLKLERLPSDSEDQWRSKQFHAVHIYRVKATRELGGNKEGELSCSSCHKNLNPPDLITPRTTCGQCHNGSRDPRADRQVIASDKPNCTSCHVQHMQDKRHWNPGLLSESPSPSGRG